MRAYSNLKKQVEQILATEEKTRNSDILLMIRLWQRFYDVGENIDLKRLYDLPQQPAVKRIRAKIQNDEKKYVPTSWEVAQSRQWEEREWKKALGYYVEPEGQQVFFLR